MPDLDRIKKELQGYIVNEGFRRLVVSVVPSTGDGQPELATVQRGEVDGRQEIDVILPVAKKVEPTHPAAGLFNEKLLNLSGKLPGSMSLCLSDELIALRDSTLRMEGEDDVMFQDRAIDQTIVPVVDYLPRIRRKVVDIAAECSLSIDAMTGKPPIHLHESSHSGDR